MCRRERISTEIGEESPFWLRTDTVIRRTGNPARESLYRIAYVSVRRRCKSGRRATGMGDVQVARNKRTPAIYRVPVLNKANVANAKRATEQLPKRSSRPGLFPTN